MWLLVHPFGRDCIIRTATLVSSFRDFILTFDAPPGTVAVEIAQNSVRDLQTAATMSIAVIDILGRTADTLKSLNGPDRACQYLLVFFLF